MKHKVLLVTRLYYIFLLILISFSCRQKNNSNKTNRYNDKNEKMGLWVYFNAKGDTIKKEFYNSNSVLVKETKYIKNIKGVENIYNGGELNKILRFYANSSIKSITHYKNGIKHFKVNYFKNRHVKTETLFNSKGKPTEFKQYFENGKLNVETKIFGNSELKVYDSLGNIFEIILYQNYEVVDTLYRRKK